MGKMPVLSHWSDLCILSSSTSPCGLLLEVSVGVLGGVVEYTKSTLSSLVWCGSKKGEEEEEEEEEYRQ